MRTVVQARDVMVMGDEGTLIEAVVNLLTNAVKYSRPRGRVEVSLEDKDDSILLSVKDHGIGIAREDLAFVLAGAGIRRPGLEAELGAGLGLAITRRIVEVHRGSISVESEPGQGSTFSILLPKLASAQS